MFYPESDVAAITPEASVNNYAVEITKYVIEINRALSMPWTNDDIEYGKVVRMPTGLNSTELDAVECFFRTAGWTIEAVKNIMLKSWYFKLPITENLPHSSNRHNVAVYEPLCYDDIPF